MRTVITNEIVKLDKTLREEIEILEIEKSHIDQAVKDEKERLIQTFKKELATLIEKTKQDQESMFLSIENEARIAFDKRLEQLKNHYLKNKDAWIEHIFASIIED